MKHCIHFFILALCILLIGSCSGCQPQPQTESLNPITDINNVTPQQGFEAMYGEAEDSCQTSSSVAAPKFVKPTNEGEKKADKDKIDKMKDDLAKSKYDSCDEILQDYQNIIKELRSGNRKPLKDFPIDSDPKIAICKSIDKTFASQLDSMQKISNQILNDLLK